jgi:hypothetical protein
MLVIRAGVLAGALLFVGAAPSDQAAPPLTISCKPTTLEALWSGTDSFACIVTPAQQTPSVYLKVSCLAPAGITCEVDPATVRVSTPPASSYSDVTVRLSYTPRWPPASRRLKSAQARETCPRPQPSMW